MLNDFSFLWSTHGIIGQEVMCNTHAVLFEIISRTICWNPVTCWILPVKKNFIYVFNVVYVPQMVIVFCLQGCVCLCVWEGKWEQISHCGINQPVKWIIYQHNMLYSVQIKLLFFNIFQTKWRSVTVCVCWISTQSCYHLCVCVRSRGAGLKAHVCTVIILWHAHSLHSCVKIKVTEKLLLLWSERHDLVDEGTIPGMDAGSSAHILIT